MPTESPSSAAPHRHIPNLITIGRLVVTAFFFIVINLAPPYHAVTVWIAVALVLFAIAVASDILDGYLARAWKAESVFGRVVDPFADKILICGAFVFFSVPGWKAWPMAPHLSALGVSPTGITAWMAVVLIAREFLVTGIRSLAEGQGIDFRAQWAGKVKMVLQCSAVIGVIVCQLLAWELPAGILKWFLYTRDLAIWLTLAVTVLSAWQYISMARRLIR